VARLCPAATGNQSQFDALVSFAYNCGLGALQRSSLRQAYNRGDLEAAADGFMKYTRGGGRVLPGLVRRRTAEKGLFSNCLS
jgi:lysozyme